MKNQLFRDLIGFEIDNFRDTSGRPLGEQRASRIYQNIDTEMRTCQLPGSRHHHPKQVNWSAMKGILSSWRETVAFLNCLDIQYKKHRGRSSADYLDFWLKTAVSVMWPSFLVFQHESKYPDGQLPLAV